MMSELTINESRQMIRKALNNAHDALNETYFSVFRKIEEVSIECVIVLAQNMFIDLYTKDGFEKKDALKIMLYGAELLSKFEYKIYESESEEGIKKMHIKSALQTAYGYYVANEMHTDIDWRKLSIGELIVVLEEEINLQIIMNIQENALHHCIHNSLFIMLLGAMIEARINENLNKKGDE